jgi:hypothetical protein
MCTMCFIFRQKISTNIKKHLDTHIIYPLNIRGKNGNLNGKMNFEFQFWDFFGICFWNS